MLFAICFVFRVTFEKCTDVYCVQLEKLREAIAVKRPGLLNRNKLRKRTEMKFEILSHPPYSPGIAP
ncbi:hypothetical protein WH47_05438 [Habropoda laboriosa]|uniref:Histone-lysine N-methyltransferase SETMAR n=1 Tax=Habropoda laboriosa TaxID=597456 RepID=A0A0L7QUY3_9HYME|nr:hypothetical protein WH47_05438 [Habropoda laboriosa]